MALARERAASRPVVTLADAEAALGTKALRYGRDDHYDVISAFIKSIRGSDPDAGLYWLARMLESGEDARFIARRLVILASEDIGRADSTSLLVADAAARAVEFVGLPEAQLNLAHAVVHLATAPKSNRVTVALGRARADVRERGAGEVPNHLRDAHYQGAKSLGHGEGYDYPHDDPRGWVPQQYRPDGLEGRTYYVPSDHGDEAAVRPAARRCRKPTRRSRPSDAGRVVMSAGDLAAVIVSVVMIAAIVVIARGRGAAAALAARAAGDPRPAPRARPPPDGRAARHGVGRRRRGRAGRRSARLGRGHLGPRRRGVAARLPRLPGAGHPGRGVRPGRRARGTVRAARLAPGRGRDRSSRGRGHADVQAGRAGSRVGVGRPAPARTRCTASCDCARAAAG